MIAYCIMTMWWQRYFVVTENPIDWDRETSKNFICINWWDNYINCKSITEISVVKNAKHYQTLHDGYVDIEIERKMKQYLNVKEQERLKMLNLPLNQERDELPNRKISN